jgi:hypothetical protein
VKKEDIMKNDLLYTIAMNGRDILAVIPRGQGRSVKATIQAAVDKAGITDYSGIQIFLNCELKDEAFEGDLVLYRSKKTGDLIDARGNPRLYAILPE